METGLTCVLCGSDKKVRKRRVNFRHLEQSLERELCKRCADQLDWLPGEPPKLHPRSPTPYGYANVNGRTVRFAREFEGVQRILELRKIGLCYDAIADCLNKERVPTKRGGIWRAKGVEKIFRLEAPRSNADITPPRPSRYGYRKNNGETIEDEYEQKIVAWMVESFKRGESKQWIADALNSNNISTKRGGKWFPLTVSSILDREYSPLVTPSKNGDGGQVVKDRKEQRLIRWMIR